jgi:hypothetical protein
MTAILSPKMFLLLIVACLTFLFSVVVRNAPALPAAASRQVQISDHGIKKHPEAKDIEESCNKNGPWQTWKDLREKGKFYWVCKIGDQYGIIPVVVSGGSLIGKTAFSPGNGTLNETLKYLGAWATRYNGAIR